MVVNIEIGDRVLLKKQHPCGSSSWEVVRLGADIGIKCCECQRQLLMPRSMLEKRLKSINGASKIEDRC